MLQTARARDSPAVFHFVATNADYEREFERTYSQPCYNAARTKGSFDAI